MKCEKCGLEMMLYQVRKQTEGTREEIFVCRNPKCQAFDQRLKKAAAAEAAEQE